MDEWTSDEREAFGKRLQEARRACGETLVSVGKKLGVSKQTVHAWEVGRNLPTAEALARLCDEFGADPGLLLFSKRSDWPFPDQELFRSVAALPRDVRVEIQGLIRDKVRLYESAAGTAKALLPTSDVVTVTKRETGLVFKPPAAPTTAQAQAKPKRAAKGHSPS